MTKSLFLLSMTALMLCGCQAGDKPAGDAPQANGAVVDASADEQAIRGQVDQWHKLMKTKDAAAIAVLYTDDGAVMPPNAPIGKGHEAIEKVWASLMAVPGFGLTIMP
jgi:hypothetical protein